MADFRSHRDLDAWTVAMEVVMTVYRLSSKFPKDERLCLTSQMRRAATLIPSNIAEAQARGRGLACLHFLRIALGLLAELDTHREIALRLTYLSREASQELAASIVSARRLVAGLLRSQAIHLGTRGTTAPRPLRSRH